MKNFFQSCADFQTEVGDMTHSQRLQTALDILYMQAEQIQVEGPQCCTYKHPYSLQPWTVS